MIDQATFVLPIYSVLRQFWNGPLPPKIQRLLPRLATTTQKQSHITSKCAAATNPQAEWEKDRRNIH